MNMTGWQPIETAPKDREDGILIFCPTFYQGKGGYLQGVWLKDHWASPMSYLRKLQPSHWMPLPDPPEKP